TLTTVAVFLPVVFVEGITAQLFKDLAVTVSFSLLVSLIVSLTVTPMLATKWTGRKKHLSHQAEREQESARWIRSYRNILHWSLGHRKTVVLVGLLSLVAGVGLVPFIGSEFMPASD
ncbi:efflux RND transporter permease subunit, partial [Microbacteriaceae bacterium K1510]|nr:efflux RND transporter permease subunit [Microbacteriaceae bacterium K1510]